MRVAIVGAGIAGLSTARSLVKLGHQVTLIERAASIPNPLSASGDQHRLIRRAYGGQDGYARQIGEAFDAWDEMWDDLGARHYANVGIIGISRTPGDEADALREGLERTGFPFELFDPAEACARYPFLDAGNVRSVWLSPEGGVLFCRRIARDLAAWLARHGAELMTGAEIVAIDAEAGTVTTAAGAVHAFDRVVVTAGAWVLRLFPDLGASLRTYRTAVVYLHPPADLRPAWETAPAILSFGGTMDGYGVPPVDGTGLKLGAGIFKRAAADPDADRVPAPGEGERMRDAFGPPIARIGEYRVADVVTCAYTFTADETFFSAARGKALVVSACSGHAYKFGAAIGRRVAEAVDGGDTGRLETWLRAEPPA